MNPSGALAQVLHSHVLDREKGIFASAFRHPHTRTERDFDWRWRWLTQVSRNHHKLSRVRVVSFGERAAIEAAARHREALNAGDKREGATNWSKVKSDRQTVAIAKVEGAERKYSNYGNIRRFCQGEGISIVRLDDLGPPLKTPDLLDFMQPEV